MKDKKLEKLNNELADDEFERLLQEYLDESLDSDDTLDETENLDDDTDEKKLDKAVMKLKENAKKKKSEEGVCISPIALSIAIRKDCDKTCYCDGSVTVRIATNDEVMPDLDRFKCYVYTEDYYLMCSNIDDCNVQRDDNELTYEMACKHIWLPGKYMLLAVDGYVDNASVRMDFWVDDDLAIHYEEANYVPLCGIDDVLALCLSRMKTWHQLAVLPGAINMRRKILEYRRFSLYNDVRKEMEVEPLEGNYNFLFCTRNEDFTEEVIKNFSVQIGINKTLEYIDCSTLYDATCNNPYEHLYDQLSSLPDKITCLTHLGALLSSGGKTIVKRILDTVKASEPQGLLWLCGTQQEITTLLEQFPSMKDFFTSESWIMQEPYTAFELIQAFFCQLEKEHLIPSKEVMDQVSRTIIKGGRQDTLPDWSLSDIRRMIADNIRPRYVRRAIEMMGEEIPFLELEDIDTSLLVPSSDTFERCLNDLKEMVGLDEVKQGIITMANNTRFYTKRRRQGLHNSCNVAYHCIFTGNPGTGKTTVARQLGRLYHSLGLLSRGEVIAVDRTRLVGRYIGETEENMKAVLEEARGNVLFIDEAYNLYDGSGDRKDFGARVLDSLLTVLSQPNPDMLIVFAGYEKEMDAMLNTNPGLTGRFPYKYRFADYNADQLMEIAFRLLRRDDYILSDEATSLLRDSVIQTLSQRTPNFGNARWMEQYIRNGIIPAMADRLATSGSDDYQHIEASDVQKAYEKFNPMATELKPRRKVGFGL